MNSTDHMEWVRLEKIHCGGYIKLENISCDGCGYEDSAEKFPDIWSSYNEYRKIMRKFGNGDCLTTGIGIVCPECGNYCEFDCDPDNNMLERVVRLP